MIARFLPLTVLLVVAILPRLPFLGLGFGLDPDAFENITVAQELASGGGYTASRLPGYPVHEILLFLTMAYKAPLAANLISLIAFVAATIGLHEILRRIEPSTALPLTAAFAAMPVGFAPSVEAMDYFLSLALVIFSLLLLMRQRTHASAAALGIATASRITNGAVLLAILPLMEAYKKPDAKRPIFFYGLIAGLFGLVFFSPVLLTYGAGFFTFYDDPTHPSIATILNAGLFGTWGLIGGVAAIVLSLLALKTIVADRSILSAPLFQAGMTLVVLYWIAFFRLPHEVPYLLPAIVGFLMILSLTVRHVGAVWGFAGAVAVSAFVNVGISGVSPGPIPSYYEARTSQVDVFACVLDRLHDLPENTLLLAPTHPEWAFFRQGLGLQRPDITIEKPHRFDPENPGEHPVFELETSILDRSGPGCAVAMTQIHPGA